MRFDPESPRKQTAKSSGRSGGGVRRKTLGACGSLLAVIAALFVLSPVAGGASEFVDEVHYTFTGPTSVAFDWRGAATDIRYGPTDELWDHRDGAVRPTRCRSRRPAPSRRSS